MSTIATYSVITNGELLLGFEPEQVNEAFSALFKISPEKAAVLLSGNRVIKKEIDLDTARLYKKRLEDIGVKVTLKEHLQQPESADTLSLVPTDEEIKENNVQPEAKLTSNTDSTVETVTCPKCQSQQAIDIEECQNCGVYIQKALEHQSATHLTPHQKAEQLISEEQSPNIMAEETLTGKSLAAGAGAALIGALLWSFIAKSFGYELGLIAWGIGGGIGFAVMLTGSRGEKAGIASGALVLIAILGGKYMFISDLKDELTSSFNESTENAQYMYETEMKALEAYSSDFDEQSLRQFMIEYEYSQQYETKDITKEEISYFRDVEEPRLNEFYYEKPTFDEWYEVTINTVFNEISIMDLVVESLGLTDIIFLLLGIGTAFRLGRGT